MNQPGAYLAECIDGLRKQRFYYSKAEYAKLDKLFRKLRAGAVVFVFDVQNMMYRKTDLKDGSLLRPPYPITVIEYGRGGTDPIPFGKHLSSRRFITALDMGSYVQLLNMNYDDELAVWSPPAVGLNFNYEQPKKKMGFLTRAYLPEALAWNYKKLLSDGFTREWIIEQTEADARSDFEVYVGFCLTLAKHEVAFTDVVPDKAKNKLISARGKQPLFTYKVLTIGKKKRKSRHLGGTHASPRSHLRRGYHRISKNGVSHWVKPCAIRGATPGFVHKDYRVETDEPAKQPELAQ